MSGVITHSTVKRVVYIPRLSGVMYVCNIVYGGSLRLVKIAPVSISCSKSLLTQPLLLMPTLRPILQESTLHLVLRLRGGM